MSYPLSAAISDLNRESKPLSSEELRKIDAYWRAANYLSVGQIYLYKNALLREPLAVEHIKPRLLGHWGTTPGLNFIYVHLNRLIKKLDLNVIFITGPGHDHDLVVAIPGDVVKGFFQLCMRQATPAQRPCVGVQSQFQYPILAPHADGLILFGVILEFRSQVSNVHFFRSHNAYAFRCLALTAAL